jgi:hypothetical protein
VLKDELLSIKASQLPIHQHSQGKFIFKKDKPQFHKHIITTIFTQAQHQGRPVSTFGQKPTQKFDKVAPSPAGSSAGKDLKRTSIKNVERKVAAVVKDNIMEEDLKFNSFKVRK